MNISTVHKIRVDTGPLKINNDWTGLFIRGDECASLLGALKGIGSEYGVSMEAQKQKLIKLLEKVNEHKPTDH